MLRNYLKTATRHLLHHKYYVLINVVGLGLGITLSILAYLNWKFDADFDKFHTKADQLYRIETVKSSNQNIYGVVPAPLAELAKNNIAGVRDVVVIDIWGVGVNYEDRTFYQNILFVKHLLFLLVFVLNFYHYKYWLLLFGFFKKSYIKNIKS